MSLLKLHKTSLCEDLDQMSWVDGGLAVGVD